jgi:hypothetical protein
LCRWQEFGDLEVHAHADISYKKSGEGIVPGLTDAQPRPANLAEGAPGVEKAPEQQSPATKEEKK